MSALMAEPEFALTFQIGRQYFAVDSRYIVAVLPAKDARARVTVNGRCAPLLDIRQKLGVIATSAAPPAFIIVVRVHDGLVGIAADSVSEVIPVRQRDVRNGVIQLKLNGRPYGRPKKLIDVDRLLQA
jgi:chemotaxis signal transduction protein